MGRSTAVWLGGWLAAAAALCGANCVAGDWPAFRGPQGNGVAASDEIALPLTWSATKNIAWKMPLPGPGNSSPIVSKGRVFVACAEKEGRRRHLYCFDAKNGDQRWVRTVTVDAVEPTHKTNPYAASTPVADGTRVVVWHGSPGLFCYDFDGKLLWSRKLGDVRHEWGYGSSPIITQGLVILNHGPGRDAFVAAVDLANGSVRWKRPEPGGADAGRPRYIGSWSTPIIVSVNGAEQVLCCMPTRVVAYDPPTGAIRWTCRGMSSERGDLVYTSPVVSGEFGVAFGGYNGPAFAFKLGGQGDVTASQRLWRNDEGQPQRIGSGVVVGDHVYIANAGPSTVECIDIKNGANVWRQRLGANQWGSVILAGGRLYATDQRGVTTVFAPNPRKFEKLASNSIDEPTNATPAVAGGRIYLRTNAHLFCIAE